MNGLCLHELCDPWIGNDGFGMISVCDLNEMASIKVA